MDHTQLIDTWEIHNRINLYLLDSIEEAHLLDTSTSGGRTVGEQFQHLHKVRLMWLKAAMPMLYDRQNQRERSSKADPMTKKALSSILQDSSNAITQLLDSGFIKGKITGFKPHPAAFLGYLISHESHHRGQIVLSLKQSGHKVSKDVQFGLWDWNSR